MEEVPTAIYEMAAEVEKGKGKGPLAQTAQESACFSSWREEMEEEAGEAGWGPRKPTGRTPSPPGKIKCTPALSSWGWHLSPTPTVDLTMVEAPRGMDLPPGYPTALANGRLPTPRRRLSIADAKGGEGSPGGNGSFLALEGGRAQGAGPGTLARGGLGFGSPWAYLLGPFGYGAGGAFAGA